jgi:hypothetical protein
MKQQRYFNYIKIVYIIQRPEERPADKAQGGKVGGEVWLTPNSTGLLHIWALAPINEQMKKLKPQHKATQAALQTYQHTCATNPSPPVFLPSGKKTSRRSVNIGNVVGKLRQDTPVSKTLTRTSLPKNSSTLSTTSTVTNCHLSHSSVQATSPSTTTSSIYIAPKHLPALTARA